MENFKIYAVQLREQKQEMLKDFEGQGGIGGSQSDSGSGSNSGKNGSGSPSKYQHKFFPSSALAFRPPQRHEDCRICIELSKRGDTDEIFENHPMILPPVVQGLPHLARIKEQILSTR